MTLVELMLALLIGLGTVLAVTSLLISSENHKRTTTSTNDAEQTGAYTFYALDKVLRGAGSAIAQSAFPSDRGVLGCTLNATSGATTILPRTTPFPAPFGGFLPGATATLTVAPLLIAQTQSAMPGSDVLVVMGGSGAAGGVSRQVTVPGSATVISLDNTVGFTNNDLALVSQSGTVDCLLEEVATVAPPALNVGGTTYYTANGTTTTLATLSANTASYVTPLGNAAANNVQFMLFGVGTDRTLYSYDLLQNLKWVGLSGGDVSQAIADGVVQMNAIYGLDTTGTGVFGAWAGPGDAGWDINSVMASAVKMRQIISVRVALVVRGEYYDKNPNVSPPTLTLFNGLVNGGGTSLQQTVNLNAVDQHYRYRVFEFTVPLRNMILLAGA
jgi:type IV pilus assembly protein PilW